MSMSQAIKSLADELKDTVFSHFQPKGVPQHFIGAAVIIGFAVVLLMAFLKGLESTLQPKVEKLGGDRSRASCLCSTLALAASLAWQ